MSYSPTKISTRSITVLTMIAAGNTYEQILAASPNLTYLNIFHAAAEALAMAQCKAEQPSPTYTFAERRQRYPRAYEKWTEAEDIALREMVHSGATVAQIAGRLQRNRGAIRSRIMKLCLVEALTPKEQARLRRIVERDGEGVE